MCIIFAKQFTTLRPSAHSMISIVDTLKIGHYMQENGLLVFFHIILVPEIFFVSTFGSDQFSVCPNFGSRIADIRFWFPYSQANQYRVYTLRPCSKFPDASWARMFICEGISSPGCQVVSCVVTLASLPRLTLGWPRVCLYRRTPSNNGGPSSTIVDKNLHLTSTTPL